MILTGSTGRMFSKRRNSIRVFEGGKRFLWRKIKILIEETAGTNVLGREGSQSIYGTTIKEGIGKESNVCLMVCFISSSHAFFNLEQPSPLIDMFNLMMLEPQTVSKDGLFHLGPMTTGHIGRELIVSLCGSTSRVEALEYPKLQDMMKTQ